MSADERWMLVAHQPGLVPGSDTWVHEAVFGGGRLTVERTTSSRLRPGGNGYARDARYRVRFPDGRVLDLDSREQLDTLLAGAQRGANSATRAAMLGLVRRAVRP